MVSFRVGHRDIARAGFSFRTFLAAILEAMQVALFRGVNVGGNKKLPMVWLRAQCERMGFSRVQTYIQSGNLVFDGGGPDVGGLLAAAILAEFGFTCDVMVRTAEELQAVMKRNPFPGRDPQKTLVFFLAAEPVADGVERVMEMGIAPEEICILGREMFIYFPLGQGVSKLPMGKIEKALGTTGTGRNWNTVEQLWKMIC